MANISTKQYDSDRYLSRDFGVLCPAIAEAAENGIAACQIKGFPVELFEGWRSPLRQAFLYSHGRSGKMSKKKKITWAKPWESWHQFGLAFDIALDSDPGPIKRWYWDTDLGKYEAIAAIMIDETKLQWLGNGDAGHFQLTGGLSIQEANAIRKKHGLLRVWLEVMG